MLPWAQSILPADVNQQDETPAANSPAFCNKCKWDFANKEGEPAEKKWEQACQRANHGSALAALRPSLTSWPWPWPKCQRLPIRVTQDHHKTLARDVLPWQHWAGHKKGDGGCYAFYMLMLMSCEHTHMYMKVSIMFLFLSLFNGESSCPKTPFLKACRELGEFQQSLAQTLRKLNSSTYPHVHFLPWQSLSWERAVCADKIQRC